MNGGAVSDGERESAERFFIRYYQDRPEQELPQRYPDVSRFGSKCLYMHVHVMPGTHRIESTNILT